ncbi:MAG: TIGR04219 family outer membrane beta-barrel protein [Candidatus Methylomirabilales bacterium]
MKKIRVLLLLLFTVAAYLVPQRSFAIGIEAAVGAWHQNPSGDIRFLGDQLDVESDFRFDAEFEVVGRIKLDLPALLPNIYVMATPLEFEETGNRIVTFNFGNQTFSAGVPFRSRIKLDHYDIALFYSIPFLKTATLGKLNTELGVNLRVIDFEAEVTQTGTNTSASKSFTAPIPMAYAGIQFKPIKRLSIEAEARGIAFSSNHYVDLIGRVKVRLLGPLFVAGGYRYEDIEIDTRDVIGSFKFQGPFVEVGVTF